MVWYEGQRRNAVLVPQMIADALAFLRGHDARDECRN